MIRENKKQASHSHASGLRQFANIFGDAYLEIDLSGNIIHLNKSAGDLFGRSSEELVGIPLLSLAAEQSRDIAAESIRKALGGQSVDCELILTNRMIVQLKNHPLRDQTGAVVGVFGRITDITDRRSTEDALKKTEYQYRTLIEGPLFAMIIHDVAPYFVTRKAAQLFGYESPGELMNSVRDIEALFREDYRINMKKNRALRYQTKQTSIVELVGLRKDGKEIPLLTGINVIQWKGEPAIQCTYYDITELKKTQDALEEQRNQLATILSAVPCWVTLAETQNGTIVDANGTFSVYSGYLRSEVIGKNAIELGILEQADQDELIRVLLTEGKVDNLEIPYRRKDGTRFHMLLSARRLDYQGNDCLITTAIDITQRKAAEAALRESEERVIRLRKMESLGLLAGGVAHDLNNVLAGIVSYPELLLMDLPEDSQLRKPIETIQESGNRAAAIVQDLLTMARGVATAKEPVHINHVVTDYLNCPEFLKLKNFHPAVEFKTDLDTDLFIVSGSEVHIRKVVMNLVSNASEAIETYGTVTISTRNCYVDRPLWGYDDVEIGEYTILSISDDGSGISSDDLERVFEPFYTKKVMGKSGTGLGLPVVWNVVQDHKGYIDVTSDVRGTTFEVYLPVSMDERLEQDFSIPIDSYRGNKERVLVVDDEKIQREIACKMLDALGYETASASSGENAVEYLGHHRADLVLLDMIMNPGINGRKTYERIIKLHPGQKAIIVSGFVETEEVKKTQQLGAGQYIKKPLTLKKLGIAVKEELLA